MSPIALVLVIFGLLIAITRAPFVVAPAATRAFYMKWFETDGRMRVLGVFLIAIGAALIWAGNSEDNTLAQICFGMGLFMTVLGAVFFILLPAPMRKWAAKIWSGFSEPALRILGFVAVIFGLALANYGMSL
jgi:uncharacterized protein YjeT (DUF2065 family)